MSRPLTNLNIELIGEEVARLLMARNLSVRHLLFKRSALGITELRAIDFSATNESCESAGGAEPDFSNVHSVLSDAPTPTSRAAASEPDSLPRLGDGLHLYTALTEQRRR